MNDDPYHFPPDVHQLLVDAIPRLCKSKPDLLTFFRGAGCDEAILAPHRALYNQHREAFKKPLVCREILTVLNERGDAALRTRREVIKRVCETDDFSTCWPDDVLKAKGYVAELRRLVNVKDSFTRMKEERDRERAITSERYDAEAKAKRERLEQLGMYSRRLGELATMQNAAKRGKALEGLLNDWFKEAGIGLKQAFEVRLEGAGVVEQIDGIIKMEGHHYLVEIKWRGEPLGTDQISQHLVRVTHREARGILISASGFTAPAVETTRTSLVLKTLVLCDLAELAQLLERRGDLKAFLIKKVDAAISDREPWFRA